VEEYSIPVLEPPVKVTVTMRMPLDTNRVHELNLSTTYCTILISNTQLIPEDKLFFISFNLYFIDKNVGVSLGI